MKLLGITADCFFGVQAQAGTALKIRSNTSAFGFNGKLKDNEVAGMGNWQDYGMRMFNPRIARFPSVDPLTKKFPYYTPYQFAGNKPIACIDLDGAEEFWSISGKQIGVGNPDDKRKMMVLRKETAQAIKDMTEAERAKVLDNQPWDVVTAPTPEMMGRMEEAYKLGEKKEFGFVTGRNDAGEIRVSPLVEGDGDGVNLGPAISKMKADGYTPLSGNHLHPTGYTFDGTTLQAISGPVPSTPESHAGDKSNDIDNQAFRLQNGLLKESSVVIGEEHSLTQDMPDPGVRTTKTTYHVDSEKKATYYGGVKNQQVTIPFEKLKEASKKIYKDGK